jgi:hypothetical protein
MFLVFFFIAYVVKFLTPEIELHRHWGLHLCKLEYMYQNDKKNNITAKFGCNRNVLGHLAKGPSELLV